MTESLRCVGPRLAKFVPLAQRSSLPFPHASRPVAVPRRLENLYQGTHQLGHPQRCYSKESPSSFLPASAVTDVSVRALADNMTDGDR